MNFTDKIDSTDAEVELKYCERCGALFFRLPGAGLVYCLSCMTRSAELSSTAEYSSGRAQALHRSKLKTPRRRSKIGQLAQIGGPQGVATVEVLS
jgi:uncharacterized Zn finger protein (UPF0148 family)